MYDKCKKITNEDIDQDAGVKISLRKYVNKCIDIIKKKYKEVILVCLTITSYQTTDKKKRIFR